MWLPDIYNRYAQYSELYPNDTLTICEVIEALKLSAGIETVNIVNMRNATNSSTGIDSDVYSNLTASQYAIETEEAVVCTAKVNPIAFRNCIIIGVFCMTVYSLAGIVINFVDTKRLMGEFVK